MSTLRPRRHALEQDSKSNLPRRTSSAQVPLNENHAADSAPRRAAPHVSKLAKRPSQAIKAPDNSTNVKLSAPATAVRQPQVVAPKRLSGIRPSEVPLNDRPSSSSRHDVHLKHPLRRTPSLVSGSTISTYDSPRSGPLRRKPSIINEYAMSPDQEKRSRTVVSPDISRETVFGISLPRPAMATKYSDGTRDITTPFSEHTQTSTPSTRFADSPFSHIPTPSSASSCSPGLVTKPDLLPRSRLVNRSAPQSRPPVSGRATEKTTLSSKQGLPLVREASTSSSSSTTKAQSQSQSSSIQRKESLRRASEGKSYDAPTSSSRNRIQQDKPITTTAPRKSVYVPPELAHLNVDPPRTLAKLKIPPARPSRDGTATLNLADMAGPSRIVRSDLPRLYTTYHKRTPSSETPPSSQAPPRIDSAISPPSTTRLFSRSTPPAFTASPATESRRLLRKDSPAIGSLPSPSKSPLRFFSRKPKPITTAEKPKREPRKGPAAGTGHEGYGRFGFRGRGSISSNGSNDSTTSLSRSVERKNHSATSSKEELDDFLRERLTPVVLRGSGSTFSAVSSEFPSSSIPASSTSSSLESYPTPQLLPSAMRIESDDSPSKYRPQITRNSSGSEESTEFAALGNRNVFNHTAQFDRASSPLAQRAEGKVAVSQNSPFMTNDLFGGREGLWLRSSKLESAKPRKQNFFERSRALPRSKGKEKAVDSLEDMSLNKSSPGVAHYALLDATRSFGLEEIERIAHENDTSTDESMSESHFSSRIVPYEKRHSSLLPSPSMQTASLTRIPPPEQQVQHAIQVNRDLDAPQVSPRQPRLSPVGRIPRVVSKRDRDRRLPDSSFSRPFVRNQPHPDIRPHPNAQLPSLPRKIRDLASPIETISQPTSSTSTGSNTAGPHSTTTYTSSVSTNRTSVDMQQGYELPLRKDSGNSYTSSNASWLAALSPEPAQIDDPWNEYNDLIDDMMLLRTPLSATSSCGAPFQYSDLLERQSALSQHVPLRVLAARNSGRHSAGPVALSVPQMARFLQPSLSPIATPQTIRDFYDQYDNRSSTMSTQTMRQFVADGKQADRQSSIDQRGNRSSTSSTHSRSASLPDAVSRDPLTSQSMNWTPMVRFSRHTQLLDIAEDDERAPRSSLRLGALLTSRWLSFGQVLFSPARNEIRLTDEPRILIIDGLGSDWSHYVAANYGSATVYNLGLDTSTNVPLQNHRQIPHKPGDSFPFPKGFFTTVVYRFPIASSEQTYQDYLQECKRVLRPGGYLEVAVLDLDLMNMGATTRRAIRDLKVRLQKNENNITLRNMSDVLVQLIGRRGFDSIYRCIVGVPVAGRIPTSKEDSTSSCSESDSDSDGHSFASKFADLMNDTRNPDVELPKDSDADDNITKMVAKVGRWWYKACYESRNTGYNIWNSQDVLRECELQGTKFRMLICHAQKPAQIRRRTVSI
ncbi:Hypothetical protein R9X50_00068900 [Acrodontium crateriforme]|uniref:Methyltransferase type 11 domain-containing protein n=1 Tax=Acrodontium crateriforme TaxID=150365 RepID=A0AAQ3LYK1_9PEZI|nr:Hypothetical protein R9X50_00068900 [Acrodontium crateriforme]